MSVVVAKPNEWAVEANDTPTLLIRVPRGDDQPPVYYLVIAQWEYDKSCAQSPEEEEDCDAIAQEFAELPGIGAEARMTGPARLTSQSLRGRPCNTRPGAC
jgi:hypothetical protein